jgi:hypothetical protein
MHVHYGGPRSLWLVVAAYYGVLFLSTWLINRWREEVRGCVRADSTGLRIDDRVVVKRETIPNGYVLERDGQWIVRLGRRFRPVDIDVRDAAEGEALLAAMRLDPNHSVARFTMFHGTFRGSLVRMAVGIGLLSTIGLAVPVAVMLATRSAALGLGLMAASSVVLYAYLFNQWLKVAAGADGLRVKPLLIGRTRYIPFTSIVSASIEGRNITIHTRDGTPLRMHHPASHGWKWLTRHNDRAHDAAKLIERINERVAAHGARTDDAPIFARAGRQTDAWLRDVITAADVNASYRSPAVPPDELWRIVEDTTAPATARAGAAVALRPALDASDRVRLGAVADACAAPRLRVALEAVASSDEDEARLHGALDPLDDDDGKERRQLSLGI